MVNHWGWQTGLQKVRHLESQMASQKDFRRGSNLGYLMANQMAHEMEKRWVFWWEMRLEFQKVNHWEKQMAMH
jgi:hypothetical protein